VTHPHPIEQYEGETEYEDKDHMVKCLCFATLFTAIIAGLGFIGWVAIRSVAQ
jgi:hypothetical protein